MLKPLFSFLCACILLADPSSPITGKAVQKRISEDIQKGCPIVVHVIVALCDNRYQGIVPVPKAIGNGQDPTSNLYWGAGNGLRTYFIKRAGWKLVSKDVPSQEILERLVLCKTVIRDRKETKLFLVAEAWDGKEIKTATQRFLSMAAGEKEEILEVLWEKRQVRLKTAGFSHLVVYVGHDGLMDFRLPHIPAANHQAPPRSSVVLACASQAYFGGALDAGASHKLVLTSHLMAPEAYTLDAAVMAWARGESPEKVREAAAVAYDRFQKCGIKAARKLFVGEP